ncbi:MAG TPA: integrase [Desulfobacter sp.]|nr:integrase [Desulfobacter sp.]
MNGKQIEEGLGWASKGWNESEANETLSELKKNYRTGDGANTLKEKRRQKQYQVKLNTIEAIKKHKENITFNQMWEKYFPYQKSNISERSWKRETSLFNVWISPNIGSLPIKNIGELHLQKIKSKMEEAGRKPRSIKYAFAVIRQVYNFLNRTEGLDYKSPTKLPNKKIRFDNSRDRFLTQEEARRLLSAIKKRSQSLYEISLLSLKTGMRAGEIFALEWSDINIENGNIFIKDTKSSKNRHALMTDDIKQMFEGKIKGKPHEPVFPDRNGGKRKNVSKAFFRAVKEVGLNDGIEDNRKKVVFHTLRHTFSSWLVQNGISIYELKGLLALQRNLKI